MKRIVRSYNEKYIGGVCGGIAKTFDVDPALVRMITVFVTVATGVLPGIVTYLFGWMITPMRTSPAPLARLWPKREKGIPTAKKSVAATVE